MGVVSELVWDRLAIKYDRLWVQKYSLAPTRKKVIKLIEEFDLVDNFKLLDCGCATGQLLEEVLKTYPNAKCSGFDKSSQMIEIAKSKVVNASFSVQKAENINYEENSFDLVTCCHSFPYYDNKAIVVNNINKILKNNGYAIFVQASINNQYDKLVMSIVEKTAEKAQYLSKSEFKKLFESRFEIVKEFEVKEKFFMPTLAGFVMRKRNENITN